MERCYEPYAKNMTFGGQSMPLASMQHIPLASAYLCQDCSCVGNCARQCPACASTVLMTLAWVLDREVEEEVQQPVLAFRPAMAA